MGIILCLFGNIHNSNARPVRENPETVLFTSEADVTIVIHQILAGQSRMTSMLFLGA